MPSVAINLYIQTPVLYLSEKGVLLKNHSREVAQVACQQERRSETLDLHNEELFLVLNVLVQIIHQKFVKRGVKAHDYSP